MQDCVFCRIVNNEIPSWKVYEDENVLAFFDAGPVNEYHTLVVPKKHYRDIFDIPENELIHITSAIKSVTNLLKEKIGIENVQIINSSGTDAQQDVFHIHFHIVPRNKNDGQDIIWTPKFELRQKFDTLLNRL